MKTYEDEEFERIERENKPKSSGMDCCTYECIQGKGCPVRNQVLEEAAKVADDWDKQNKLSNYGTCIARQIRELKQSVNHT
jgi:hypothetical protein